jgi:hypothetical protein
MIREDNVLVDVVRKIERLRKDVDKLFTVGSTVASTVMSTEGPGIDIAGLAVGLSGDTILVYHADLSPVDEFAATGAGLTAALAAAINGDIVIFPAGVSLNGNFVIPDGVTLQGQGWSNSSINGTITLGTNSVLKDLNVGSLGMSASPTHAIIGPASGDARVENVISTVFNFSTGIADCLYMPNNFGTVSLYGCKFDSTSYSGVGVAIRIDEGIAGDVYVYFGSVKGSSGRFSYYL